MFRTFRSPTVLTATRCVSGCTISWSGLDAPGVQSGAEAQRHDSTALTVVEVGALAAGCGVVLPTRAAERLHRHTAGHALYVRTLLAELPPARLVEGDGDLPAPRSLSSTLVARA